MKVVSDHLVFPPSPALVLRICCVVDVVVMLSLVMSVLYLYDVIVIGWKYNWNFFMVYLICGVIDLLGFMRLVLMY